MSAFDPKAVLWIERRAPDLHRAAIRTSSLRRRTRGCTDLADQPRRRRAECLARQQDVAVLLLTKKSHEALSMHSLISLRAEARWRAREGRCEVCVRVIKDKRGGAGWTHVETCRGPAGVR